MKFIIVYDINEGYLYEPPEIEEKEFKTEEELMEFVREEEKKADESTQNDPRIFNVHFCGEVVRHELNHIKE